MTPIAAAKGTTVRLVASFLDGSGVPVTGLTVSARVQRESDGHFMDDAFAFTVGVPGSEPVFTETDSSNMPGVYHFDFQVPDEIKVYTIAIDGSGSAGSGTRYQWQRLSATYDTVSEVHLSKCVLANSRQQRLYDPAKGQVTTFDDDGETPVLTQQPGADDVDAPTLRLWTAEVP